MTARSAHSIRIIGRDNTLAPAEALRFDARRHGKTGRILPAYQGPRSPLAFVGPLAVGAAFVVAAVLIMAVVA